MYSETIVTIGGWQVVVVALIGLAALGGISFAVNYMSRKRDIKLHLGPLLLDIREAKEAAQVAAKESTAANKAVNHVAPGMPTLVQRVGTVEDDTKALKGGQHDIKVKIDEIETIVKLIASNTGTHLPVASIKKAAAKRPTAATPKRKTA